MDEQNIFLQALDKPSGQERAAWLDEVCGPDTPERERIEALLRKHEQAGSFLEQPALETDPTVTEMGGDDLSASLDAGLTSAFSIDEAVVVGSAEHSVLKRLGQKFEISQVSLREGEVDDDDPIQRPSSPEIPDREAQSKYQFQGEIARGGMGAIIKGRDTNLGRDLAIKVLLDEHKTKPEVIQRFVEEAQIGGQLQHPGIAPVYELGQFADERPFFSMKLVKGQTLSKLLAERESCQVDRSRFVSIFEQVCQTMAYAHSRGVIHRDLKPANIMVGAFGEVQVMDWGLAKVLASGGVADEKKSRDTRQPKSIIQTMRSTGSSNQPGTSGSVGSHTQMGSVMGTPAYMPPEQALGEIDVMDERADVFGLGAILCEILTGDPPYVADNSTQIFRMASRGKLAGCFERLEACGADDDLIQLTKLCLELEPVDRLRNAGVLAERVTGYLESVEAKLRETEVQRAAQAARAVAESERAEAQTARAEAESARARVEHQRRRTTLALAASVLLLISFAGGGWLYVERQEANRQAAEAIAQRTHARQMESLAEERDEQRKTAEAARAEALAAKDVADKARTAAEYDRAAALSAKEQAEAAEDAGRKLLYTTNMQLAPFMWHDPETTVAQMRRRLDQHDPAKKPALEGKSDLRGFEWYYYQHLLDHSAQVFGGPENPIIDAVLSSEGQLVTLNPRLQVQRWDLDSQQPAGAAVQLGSDNPKATCILSPDAQLAASLTESFVRVIDTNTGNATFEVKLGSILKGLEARGIIVKGPRIPKGAVQFSPDGKVAVTLDDQVRWWDTSDGRLIASANSPPFKLLTAYLSLSADYRTLAVGPYDNKRNKFSIYQLDQDLEKVTQRDFDFGGTIRLLAITPDGERIAASSPFGGRLDIYDTSSAQPEFVNSLDHPSEVSSIRFSSDGTQIATATHDGTIRLWSGENYNELHATLKGHEDAVNKVSFSPDGRKLISISSDQTARVWDIAQGNLAVRELARTVESDVAFSPDGLLVATAEDNRVILRHAATGDPVCVLINEGGRIVSLAVSPDNRLLACGQIASNDRPSQATSQISIWDIDSGRRLWKFDHRASFDHVAFTLADTLQFSPDGSHLVAGFGQRSSYFGSYKESKKNAIECINLINGRRHFRFEHSSAIVSIRFTPDGTVMATGSHDGTVRLWNTETWQPIHAPLQFRAGAVDSVAFSPDGQLLATGDTNGHIMLWDVNSAAHVRTLEGHADHVMGIAFSADGQTMASCSDDQTIRLWNTATWRELMRLDAGAEDLGQVKNVTFSADGRTLLAHAGGRVLAWSSRKPLFSDADLAATRLGQLLDSEVDFANRIRMLSETRSLHETVAQLQRQRPGQREIEAALAATRANWHALQKRWPLAAGEFDRLAELNSTPQYKWFRVPGLIRVARALFQQDQPAQATELLAAAYRQRDEDGIDPESARELASQIETFRLAVDQRLAAAPGNLSLLQLRAELHGLLSGGNDAVIADLTTVIEAVSNKPESEITLTRCLHRRADAYLADEQWQLALDDYDRVITNQTDDERLLANHAIARAHVLAEQARQKTREVAWTVLMPDPERMHSSGGATLTLRDDGSILVSGGKRPTEKFGEPDVYTITVPKVPGNVTAIRLEALTDSSLPQNGPGMEVSPSSPNKSTFALREFRVLSRGKAVELSDIFVTVPIPTGLMRRTAHLRETIDGDINKPGKWFLWPRGGRSGSALIAVDPASATSDELVFELFTGPRLGCFRLSVTDDPSALEVVRQRTAAAKVKSIADPWVKLATAYRSLGDDRAINELVSSRPQLAERIGNIFAEEYSWERAIAVYDLAINGETKEVSLLLARADAHKSIGNWKAAVADGLRAADHAFLRELVAYLPPTSSEAMQVAENIAAESPQAVAHVAAKYVGRARFYLQRRNWKAAAAAFRRAAELDPGERKWSELARETALRSNAELMEAAGRTREAVRELATLSAATPQDTLVGLKVAALLVWFQQDKEFANSRRQIVALANADIRADHAAQAAAACSLLPSTDKAQLEAMLTLGRRGVKSGPRGLMALGMAEFRVGDYLSADQTLLSAESADADNALVIRVSQFYRAMSLFRQGKKDKARKLAIAAAEKMMPLPADEQNPLANLSKPDGGDQVQYLVMWLAYKEAKALIQF